MIFSFTHQPQAIFANPLALARLGFLQIVFCSRLPPEPTCRGQQSELYRPVTSFGNALLENGPQFVPRLILAVTTCKKPFDGILLDRLALQRGQGFQALVLLVGDIDGQAAHGGLRFQTHITANVGLCIGRTSSIILAGLHVQPRFLRQRGYRAQQR